MRSAFLRLTNMVVSGSLLGSLLLAMTAAGWADTKTCGMSGEETLNPYGDLNDNYMTDLKVVGKCDINGTPQQGSTRLLYVFHNVNIIAGGQLIFHDDHDIDFYAESMLVEYQGSLIAVSTQKGFLPQVSQASGVLPYQKRLTFHLWGPEGDPGITCASPQTDGGPPCGIPNPLWIANPVVANSLMKMPPPAPNVPKNNGCKSVTGYSQYLPGDDCFYQYEIQDAQDKTAKRQAFFGHKVLAVSFGGTLQLFGSHGVSYLMQGQQCQPTVANNECNPAFSGTSWVRLTGVNDAKTQITVNRAVDWQPNDHIVITPTDYLPSHAEEVVIESVSTDGKTITLQGALDWVHRASTYSIGALPSGVGPQNDPNLPELNRAVDTRAAVSLLTRNIQIVSEGNVPSDPFTEEPDNYYGGHTIVRQGFASFQVQGVQFHELGQGGSIGRYPVHFHMDRKTPQAVATQDDPTPEPLNYLKDCSIDDSMTRWITLHATQGMYLARNVGYKSIGHGFYLEDATEINNRLYSNIGILARAAIMDLKHNPRRVPGILADNSAINGQRNGDYMPYRSDYNHPSIFWITNGWNDFQYNFAAGAATCGACYWWLPAGDSGISQYENWDGYAAQQIERENANNNYIKAGLTPLKTFKGNTCVAAMSSFQMNSDTAACLGVLPEGGGDLSAVPSIAPPGPLPPKVGPEETFQLYYPVLTGQHNSAFCPGNLKNNDCSLSLMPCDAGDTFSTCSVTQLDHYTTSFNFAQTNFSAVWLRKGWDLFSNGAVTDTQSGGLNFVTGGGYTRSDVNQGEWLVARNTVFIGHTQGDDALPYNAYAEDVGPFNPDSGLECDNSSQTHDHCEYADGGMSFNLPDYPGQKLFNIYDGPAQQINNAYLDINYAKVDCKPGGNGTCLDSNIPLAWNLGIVQNKKSTYCYLPNAAIGWKQPNGFYYPPAFHSKNLYFNNVDIRHFVIEPLFTQIAPTDYDPFQQNQGEVKKRYCTYTNNMFKEFNHIDRQTVLNDDDGTLTGLLGKQGGLLRETISINEDPFFNAPLVTPECLSDVNVKPLNPDKEFFTAGTSPYEWLTTGIVADCAIVAQVGDQQCYDDVSKEMKWAMMCSNSNCRGVPLYREYLTTQERSNNTYPQIRMMGQGSGQRSTLSLNRGAYYIDTTQNCLSQGGCPKCLKTKNGGKSCETYDGNTSLPTIFLGGHSYYVYLVYATATTKQKYDIYVGSNTSVADLKVTSITLDPQEYKPQSGPASVISATYKDPILTVNVDLTGQSNAFNNSRARFCRPQSYCMPQGSACVCKPGSGCTDNSDCSWGPKDIDCPGDPKNPNGMQCFGFSFTMPQGFVAPPQPVVPNSQYFKPFTSDPYFAKGIEFANGKSISPNDTCKYTDLPSQ